MVILWTCIHDFVSMTKIHYEITSFDSLFSFIALEGEDYTLPGTFEIVFDTEVVSDDTRCVSIDIENDSIVEGDQTFLIEISNVSPQVQMGQNNTVTVIIEDNDSKWMYWIAYMNKETKLTF